MIMYAHVSSALTEISGVQRGRVTASPCTHCIDEPRDSQDSRNSRDLHDLHESRLSHLLDLSAQICWIFSQKGPQLLLCLVISHSPGIVNKDPGAKHSMGSFELAKVAKKEDKPQNVQCV